MLLPFKSRMRCSRQQGLHTRHLVTRFEQLGEDLRLIEKCIGQRFHLPLLDRSLGRTHSERCFIRDRFRELIHFFIKIRGGENAPDDTESQRLVRLDPASCVDPVSYTHLDVYKRQRHESTDSS